MKPLNKFLMLCDSCEHGILCIYTSKFKMRQLNKILMLCDSCEHVRAQIYWLALKTSILNPRCGWYNTLHIDWNHWIQFHVNYWDMQYNIQTQQFVEESCSESIQSFWIQKIKYRPEFQYIPMKRHKTHKTFDYKFW